MFRMFCHLGAGPSLCLGTSSSGRASRVPLFSSQNRQTDQCAEHVLSGRSSACEGQARVTGANALQEYGGSSTPQQALQVHDQEELQKLVTMLPERLASTVLEQPDFSQVSSSARPDLHI